MIEAGRAVGASSRICSAAGTTIGAGVIFTLNGNASDVWVFKIGTGGLGALTGNSFQVVMGGTSANDLRGVQRAVFYPHAHRVGDDHARGPPGPVWLRSDPQAGNVASNRSSDLEAITGRTPP
jgi:hypothetical protein